MTTEKNPDFTESSGAVLPDEEPVGIIKPNVSLTKAPAPKGTSYNKNTIAIALCVLLLAFGTVIVISMSFGRKRINNSQTSSQRDQQTSMIQGQDLTPAEIGKIPGSYARAGNDNGVFTNQQDPQDPNERQNPGFHNQGNSRKNRDEPYSIPTPPPLQPVQTSQSSVSGNSSDSGQQEMTVRKSPIRFGNDTTQASTGNQKKPENGVANDLNALAGQLLNQNGNSLAVQTQPENDQNLQEEKRNFSTQSSSKQPYATSVLTPPLSPYEIKAGSMVPVVLITGLNSDLPGNIIAQVRENVYDTVSGKYLLIPQGTKVIGVYDSKVAYAQSRALVNWSRMIFPNGNSLDLQNLSGIDQSGYTGLKDKVNNHTGKLITGIFLTSVLGATVEMAQGSNNSVNPTYEELAAQGASQALQQAGNKIVQKDLDVQPTLEIRPGFLFNLFVDKDFILRPYQR